MVVVVCTVCVAVVSEYFSYVVGSYCCFAELCFSKTVSMRDKERLHDYRFMPEPNLPPLRLYTTQTIPSGTPSQQIINVDELREQMPELPIAQRTRLQQTYGLSEEHSSVLVVSYEPFLLKVSCAWNFGICVP